jgi:transposase-like protein
MAIHLLCASKKGMSAHQLHRMLGVTYKSAWFMAHRIRYAMTQPPLVDKLRGIVEVDETWIGGKERGYQGKREKKAPVVALVERGGRIRPFPVKRVTTKNLRNVMLENIEPSATIMTDEFRSYQPFVKGDFAEHHSVCHKRKEWARGIAHVNTAENFFSILKRGINGVYQHVGKQHLHRYLTEFCFRYDSRGVTDAARMRMACAAMEGKRLSYKPLVGKE